MKSMSLQKLLVFYNNPNLEPYSFSYVPFVLEGHISSYPLTNFYRVLQDLLPKTSALI